MAAYFIITTSPKSTKHICWRTRRYWDSGTEMISLIEVIESMYEHPDAPEYAVVPVMEEYVVSSHMVISHDAAPLLLLEANEKTIDLIQRLKNGH